MASMLIAPPAIAPRSSARKDAQMHDDDERALLKRLRALPAAQPLFAALSDADGVYLVGGAVRDLLLGGSPVDLDLVVEGDAAELAASLGGSVRAHDRFGTSTATVNGFVYDIARARTESYAHPGALPDVAPATLAEDLRRRDFTVNAAAIALGGARRGRLEVAPHALEDLREHRLRILHDRSFVDDPTRLLRLSRYATRLRFAIEPHTLGLAHAAIRARALDTVSGSRIGGELRLLARERDPLAALEQLAQLELDAAIHPQLRLRDPALGRRALELLPTDGRQDSLVLAVALRDVGPTELAPLLESLAFAAAERDAIIAAVTRAPALADSLARAARPSEIARAVAGAGPELVALAGALGPAAAARQWLASLRHERLEIDGRDLLAAGVPDGPLVGRGLRAALAAKLDGRATGHEAELAEAVRAAAATG
jgi:tRNA nucleotidyltransferase (CCA-adding enzyme)